MNNPRATSIWETVEKKSLENSNQVVTAQDIAMLKALSTAAGGWVVWDEATGETFIPMAEWLQGRGAGAKGDGNADD